MCYQDTWSITGSAGGRAFSGRHLLGRPMALTAAELHAAARRSLDGPLAGLGFRRVAKTRTASWIRPEGGRWLFIWFQPHRWNGAHSAGFRFTVELRLADRPILYSAGPLARLPALLSPEAREALRQMENRALARVPPPDRAYVRALPESMRPMLLADWKPRLQPYGSDEDVWFRLADRSDLEALLAFIERVLPGAIDRFADKHTHTLTNAPLVPGTPAWDRLVLEFHEGPGARIWAEVQGSPEYPDALDEALALWREVFVEWLADRDHALAPTSIDELKRALGFGQD
jgi:hypothetical protein